MNTLQNTTFDQEPNEEQKEILEAQITAAEISLVNACTALQVLANMNVDPITFLNIVMDRIELRLAAEESGNTLPN